MSSPRVIVVALAVLVVGSLAPKSSAARALFVFGDSLVDSGNNNFLITTARADSPPYGLDFPTHHPTGRFSNGFNLPDMISVRIGSVPTMPYLSPKLKGEKLLVGANFASAGIGILNDTGVQFLNIIKMFEQMELFEQYQARVSALIGPAQTRRLVNQGLVLITLGGNDFINNYFMPFSDRSRQFSVPAFSKYLISEYKKILRRLYELGARRVLVAGTGPLGCVPAVLASSQSVNGQCAPEPQRASAVFNPLLKAMIKELNTQLGADVFVIANAFDMNMDFISKPHKFGFVTSKVACCGQGAYNGVGLCNVLSSLCPYRNLYAFWDAYHPTERANRFIAEKILTGTIDYMYPMNLSTVMALDSST